MDQFLAEDTADVFEEISRTQNLLQGLFSQQNQTNSDSDIPEAFNKQMPGINARSHKISKQERPKVRITKKH